MFGNKFEVYKARFSKKEKVVRKELDQLSSCLETHKLKMAKGVDTEADKEILQRFGARIQTLVDELDELMNHMQKLDDSRQHKSTILRFK